VASLVAAGLDDQLEALTIDTDFADFLDEGALGRVFGPLGSGLDLLAREGIHRGRVLHRWIHDTLAAAGVTTWGDLRLPGTTARTPIEHRYRLVVIVSDVSRGRMLRLPWDYERLLGTSPDSMPVADAVRPTTRSTCSTTSPTTPPSGSSCPRGCRCAPSAGTTRTTRCPWPRRSSRR
jgi:NTE family protein